MEQIVTYWGRVYSWWWSLSVDDRDHIWIAAGVVLMVVWWWFGAWAIRRLAGYRKFRGTWYSESAFQQLLVMLAEDQAEGNRVMRYDEISLLRQWRQGRAQGLGFDSRNSYFP